MENKRDRISLGQLAAVVWTAVLAPGTGVVPGAAARTAGAAGWLSTLLALPVILLVGWAVWRLTRNGREDLAQSCCRVLGRAAGSALLLLYLIWCVVLLALRLRLGGYRLLLAGSPTGEHWLCLPAILAVAVWLAWGKTAMFARATRIFFSAVAVVLGGVALLGISQVKWCNLWPVWGGGVVPACRGGLQALGTLSVGIYGAFLLGGAGARRESGRRWDGWTVGMCLGLSVVQVIVLGNFGAELTARLEDPFLALSGSVGVEGAFQRVEGLVAAVWILSDLVMLALLMRAGARMSGQISMRWGTKAGVTAGAVLALLGANVGLQDPYEAQLLERTVVPVVNLLLGVVVPAVLFLISEVKEKTGKERTSCAADE